MIPITSPKLLGQVLRKYRKVSGLTQTEAGRKFNLTQKTVSNIESGLPGVHVSTVFKLLSALELEIHLQPRASLSDEEPLW